MDYIDRLLKAKKQDYYCKTLIFREYLIFAQICKGGQGRHRQLQMAITSLIVVRFSGLKLKSSTWVSNLV